MRYLLLLTAVFIAQLSASCFGQQLCPFTTDGTGKSLGLKIKFSVPCQWKNEGSSGKYLRTYEHEDGDVGIAEMISIDNPTKPVTPGRIDELVAAETYKKLEDKGGTFLWGVKLKVDGQDCAEVCMKLKKKILFVTAHIYIMRYILYCKGKAVTMNFMVTAETDQEAKKYFSANKALFRSLVLATDLPD